MARLGDHDLRAGGIDPAGVDVADAAGLSQHLHENRHRRCACGRGGLDSPGAANAGADKIHRRERIGFCRSGVSFCLHHHRVWRRFRISLAHRFGNDTENAGARIADPGHRLRGHDYRDDGGINGDDRCLRDSAG